MASTGIRTGVHDLWIGATAPGHGLTVAAGDARDFQHVPGLAVEAWTGA